MRYIITIILLFVLAVANADDSTGVYWLFFKDKGPDIESRIVEFQKSLPERTIQRRAKALGSGIVADYDDLPIYEKYLDIITEHVVDIRQQSRWLNAVSVVVLIPNLAEIEKLEIIDRIQPVASSDPQSLNYEITESWQAGERNYQEHPTGMDYGASFRQLEQMNAIWAHERGFHGEDIIICFLDTGFELYHHAFNHMNIIASHDFINDDDFVGQDDSQDRPGQARHGTGCLGTIGGYYPGELIGPAFAASYILCKTEETGSETAVEEDYYVAGLEWGELMGADLASSSLSYSNWYSDDDFDGVTCVTTIAANIAFDKGMILCSSMGNSGPGRFTLGAPADSPKSLGIGGVQWNGLLYRRSSWGPTTDGRIKPDICARAVATIAASPYTTDSFGKWNGTSLSCPLVAGAAALIIQAHPDWAPMQVKEAILETGSRANRPDIRFGWGIINVRDAINYPSLSGYIVDSITNRGIVADIALKNETDEELSISSDSSGYFLLPNLNSAEYQVEISKSGYYPETYSISVPPSDEIDFSLQPIN